MGNLFMSKFISIPYRFKAQILACGAEAKAGFCLTKKDRALISPVAGDLKNPDDLAAYEKEIKRAEKEFSVRPGIVACDLHPEYSSTKFARGTGLPVYEVQHHHAHVVSCMAENGLIGEVIGVSFDGTGLGMDDTIWGGEFLISSLSGFKRARHLDYIAMPGGEAVIREPRRMAMALLYKVFGEEFLGFAKKGEKANWQIWRGMIDKKINSPLTSSSGRLFDAVAALIGIREKVDYEAQAAIELEKACDRSCKDMYDMPAEGDLIKPDSMVKGIMSDLKRKRPVSEISGKFHNSMVNMIVTVARRLKKETGIKEVVLSGGVFQNKVLLKGVLAELKDAYTHSKVSTTDAGISFGQAVAANARV